MVTADQPADAQPDEARSGGRKRSLIARLCREAEHQQRIYIADAFDRFRDVDCGKKR